MICSNEELIDEIIHGNKAAMDVLINKNYKLVFAFIQRNIGEYHTALDLTQESFIRIIKNLKNFKSSEGNFEAWILKIALNICKDYWKSAYFKRMVVEDTYINTLTNEDNVINYLEKCEKRQNIKNAVLSLPEQQREVLILKYYHDLKIKDIASITETNESTVKSRLRLSIMKLKKLIKRGDDSEQAEESI